MTPRRSRAFHRLFVNRAEALPGALEILNGADAIGLDVEMGQRLLRLPGGVTKGEQILALIQIADDSSSVAVDPLRVRDLTSLAPLFASDTVKVVLGGATDIQLLEDHKLPVHNIVDLAEVAVSVFGHREEGMRALADRALGIVIDKSIRREDWMRRPINPAMLSYAHRDAELTIQLYRWFVEHHPEAVTSHARRHFHPPIPEDIAEWVRRYLTKRMDVARLLKEMNIDPAKETARLVGDIRLAEQHHLSPGQKRRLIRAIGDLKLSALYDDVLPYAASPSAVFRASAARALGRLGDMRAQPVLERLQEDPLDDVKAAAEVAVAELTGKPKDPPPAESQSESPSAPAGLDAAALQALERVKSSLDPAAES